MSSLRCGLDYCVSSIGFFIPVYFSVGLPNISTRKTTVDPRFPYAKLNNVEFYQKIANRWLGNSK